MSRPVYTVKPKKDLKFGKSSGPGSEETECVEQDEWLRLTQYSVDHFPESAIWTDMEAHILYVNEAACDILGYTQDELLCMTIPDIDRDHPFRTYASFIPAIKQRRSITFESVHTTKAGHRIPVEVSAHYEKFGDQEYIISFSRDISRRKSAEDALKESEERFRGLVENIHDILWTLDPDLKVTYISPNSLEIMGYAPEELLGKTPYDFIYPDDIPGVSEIVSKAIEDRKPLRLLDYRMLRKDGRIIWVEANGELILGPDGALLGLRGANRDVTERKVAEDSLRESEERFRSLVENINDMVWVIDTDYVCKYISPKSLDLMGYTPGEILGRKPFDFILPEDIPKVEEAFSKAIPSMKPIKLLEYRVLRKDGRIMWMETNGEPITDSRGRLTGYRGINRDVTERKVAEEALREGEAKYRSLVENINDMIWEMALDFSCTYASPKTLEIIGYAPQEILGKKVFDYIHPDDIPGVKAITTQAIANQRSWQLLEYRFRRKDGRYVYLQTNGEPIFDSGGRLIGYRGTNRDVTELKEAEEALRKNEQFLNRIFNSFQDGISILDKNLRVVRVNRIMEELYPHMMPLGGKACYMTYHGRDKPCEVCPSIRAMKLKTLQSDIVALLGEHGEQKGWLEIYAFPLLDDRGDVTGVIEHVRNITARKQAEDALHESEERFRLFADMSPAILLIYQDDRYIYANRAAEVITGYSRGELYRNNPWFLIHPDYRENIRDRVLARESGEQTPLSAEIKIVTKSGEEKWMAMNSATINYKNRPAGIVVAFDTSEQKKTALALEEAKARAELYLDLITHDINNMNQVGIGFLDMLSASPRLDEGDRELLEKAEESMENSTRLIQNVQKLQRIRSGELRNQIVNVGQVLNAVASYYRSTKGGDHIEYTVANDCSVMANGLLFDVFSNLLGNAIKHTGETGNPTVNVLAGKATEGGKAYCRVTIEDRGPGIPDELKARIFDRLRRGSTKAHGKGLGLYLVKSLVESFGGKVWVEDRVPGDYTRGSRFVVMLPAAEP